MTAAAGARRVIRLTERQLLAVFNRARMEPTTAAALLRVQEAIASVQPDSPNRAAAMDFFRRLDAEAKQQGAQR